jgi:predicted DNA-binding protein (UPF0251 family)
MEGFKPFGVPMKDLEPVMFLYEEFESVRLADYENLTQEEAALRMGVSRPTFTRIYEKARKSIAKAFVEGKAILIQGGDYVTDDYWFRCLKCKEVIIAMKPIQQCRKCNSDDIVLLNNNHKNGKDA